MKTRRYARFAIIVLAVLGLAWLLPSVFNAERYRRRLQANVQRALGRPVRFGAISLKVIPRPGFSVDNATVFEQPGFGSEPFARASHIDCDLDVLNLLRGRTILARLRLQGSAINLVRNSSGQWNVERLGTAGAPASPAGYTPPDLAIDVVDGRLNFKFGPDKKPFAVTGVNGRVAINRKRRTLKFDLAGFPVRTDLALPSPGKIELQGSWTSVPGGPDGDDPLEATMRTRGTLIYDWIPLLAGRNPGVYGMMDAQVHLTGSVNSLSLDGNARLTEVRRWESLPPTGDLPVDIAVKGWFDRRAARATIEQLRADFGASHLSVQGTIAHLGADPALDLTATLAPSRLEDFETLAGRLDGQTLSLGGLGPLRIAGGASGAIAVEGSWSQLRYSGAVSTSGGELTLRAANFPLSDATLRFDAREIDLLPIKISATPRLTLVAGGALRFVDHGAQHNSGHGKASGNPRPETAPGYQFSLSARSAPVDEVVGFARRLNLGVARTFGARGTMSLDLTATGTLWPPSGPALEGAAELHSTQVLVPGLAHPVEIREAHLSLDGDRFTADPVTASFAGSVFAARLAHTGARSEPWTFDVRSSTVDLARTLSSFEAFRRAGSPWFERFSDLSQLASRQTAGAGLFSALNAQGDFRASALICPGVTLRDVRGRIEISQRLLRLAPASFRISSGHGAVAANADLSGSVPHLAVELSVAGLRVENWASHLPPQLAGIHGGAAFSGHAVTQGISRSEIESNLTGSARLRLADLNFGDFDPLGYVSRAAGWDDVPPAHTPLVLRSADVALELRNRRAVVKPLEVAFGGALFDLVGSCGFDGEARFESAARLRVSRPGARSDDVDAGRTAHFLLAGPLRALKATPEE